MRAQVFLPLLCACFGCTVDPIADNAAFPCDPAHVDHQSGLNIDCGAGFVCYSAAAALGGSICLHACVAGQCPSGYGCTGAGGCMQECDPAAGDIGCPMPLHCLTTKAGASGPTAGACLPVAATCRGDEDCTSTVFNSCFAITQLSSLAPPAGGGAPSVTYCVQSGCEANQTACSPGSTCLRTVLPMVIPAPDLCVPDCDHNLECPPDMLCSARTFPVSNSRICIPGFYDFACNEDLSCLTAGSECAPIVRESATVRVSVCSVSCAADGACPNIPPQTRNPDPDTLFSCRKGHCASLSALANALTCFRAGTACGDGGRCENPTVPSAPAVDGGVPQTLCGIVGATNSPPPFCARPCEMDADCRALEGEIGVPLACADLAAATRFQLTELPWFDPAQPSRKLCVPRLPLLPCTDQGSCLSGLACTAIQLPDESGALTPIKVCTKPCKSDLDCAADDPAGFTLGPGFACGADKGLSPFCYPKIPSGRPARVPALCMSQPPAGITPGFLCQSEAGIVCEEDDQCRSHRCVRAAPCSPAGVCQ